MTPIVSIIVCTYNQEQYIKQTLDSILMQQCNFEFEILVGEDCGTDSTRKICEDYAAKYSQVKVLDRPQNLGKQKNFFDALIQCKGKYVSMCDGDDYWQDPLMLQKEVDYLESHPECVIVYHDSIMVDGNGNVISETEVGPGRRCDFSSEELIVGRNISNRTICFRNVLDFSKIDITGVYNEDSFVYSVIGHLGVGHFIDGIKPSVYRILNGSIWNDQQEIKRLAWIMDTTKAIIRYYKSINMNNHVLMLQEKLLCYNEKLMFQAVEHKNKKIAWSSLCLSLSSIEQKDYCNRLFTALKSFCKCLIK